MGCWSSLGYERRRGSTSLGYGLLGAGSSSDYGLLGLRARWPSSSPRSAVACSVSGRAPMRRAFSNGSLEVLEEVPRDATSMQRSNAPFTRRRPAPPLRGRRACVRACPPALLASPSGLATVKFSTGRNVPVFSGCRGHTHRSTRDATHSTREVLDCLWCLSKAYGVCLTPHGFMRTPKL